MRLRKCAHFHQTSRARGGEPKVIGGTNQPTADVEAKCFAKMKCWVRLAMWVCKTEWPSFDAFAAFDCLALSSSQRHHREDADISGNDKDID
eukprot:1498700-Alexandrium_andersonii.AAC.1